MVRMRFPLFILSLVLLLSICCFGQGGLITSGAISPGSVIAGGTGGAPPLSSEDVPFPNYSDYPLQMPTGFNSQAYLTIGNPQYTVFIGDATHICPKAASLGAMSGCGIYQGYVGQVGNLTFLASIPASSGSFAPLNSVLSA